MANTITQSIRELHQALSDYIEATYHISDANLVAQRKALLDEFGVISQKAYLESTPKYVSGSKFETIQGIPQPALELYEALSSEKGGKRLIFDPPYRHQLQAVDECLVKGRNLVIMTGTGSGKTESFLLPILGKLAREARQSSVAFQSNHAVRAMILYPMNALVNDQLSRLRTIFSDNMLKELFTAWSDRVPTFARYTSRTPYPGVRTAKKDQVKLKSFEKFFVEIERAADDNQSANHQVANNLKQQLLKRGKWPGKPSLTTWFGNKSQRWDDPVTRSFLRAVTLPEDSELLTRHEIQSAPPDLMITNYSMLEYMLMRPIERPIFDQTAQWLKNNPNEKFLIVLDEAHLYRGAAGAEVGLLLRRLRDRLGISQDRFQVICSTASFSNKENAADFAAQLAGVRVENFSTVTGDLQFQKEATGNLSEASLLASIAVSEIHEVGEAERLRIIEPLLNFRNVKVTPSTSSSELLYAALKDFDVLNLLVNVTMKGAVPIADLGKIIFPTVGSDVADRAITSLLVLGSLAKQQSSGSGILPCRIHNFFRGLPGLWACVDPDCSELSDTEKNGYCGKLFGQPRNRCGCGSRVFEFYTCRHCGSPYLRAYTDNPQHAQRVWADPGEQLRLLHSDIYAMFPIDILLKEPANLSRVRIADMDLLTGTIDPDNRGEKYRRIYLTLEGHGDEDDQPSLYVGQFVPCGICGKRAGRGASSIQDHQTKGDQPFLSLLSKQIQIQPPTVSSLSRKFAPLQGRKVLVFSDSRQVAARLAPNLQMYSSRDVIRPLLIWGMQRLQAHPQIANHLSIDNAYFALMVGASKFNVRLRPELRSHENFAAVDTAMSQAVDNGALENEGKLLELFMRHGSAKPPESLIRNMISTMNDWFTGFEPLAFGSVREIPSLSADITQLPVIPGVAESDAHKVQLARLWLMYWLDQKGYWMNDMPDGWWRAPKGIDGHGSGNFAAMGRFLERYKGALQTFKKNWVPKLLDLFTHRLDGGLYRLMAKQLTFDFEPAAWLRCDHCTSVQREVGLTSHCTSCGESKLQDIETADQVFKARKGYYRNNTVNLLAGKNDVIFSLVAGEHTAQLNAPQGESVFSQAEINELLFQDIDFSWPPNSNTGNAIDILSSTTTMEVGIDIGALSGVALRNLPPGRANYQQRAGRAGRRGNAVATVVAFGSVDSHDEHYFTNSYEMISGPVVDPVLTLNSPDIAKRHIRAFLLQRYHQTRLPAIPDAQQPDLFSVLGKVEAFKKRESVLNRYDFENWLNQNKETLQERVGQWIPIELSDQHRMDLIETMINDCLQHIDLAIEFDAEKIEENLEGDGTEADEPEDSATGKNNNNLLDRLLYCGILPRYAFPTEVATFHVFDANASTGFRPVMKFAPSQALPVALSQYSPGKQVWIAHKCYHSGAIYSPIRGEREKAWKSRKLYFECTACGFGKTEEFVKEEKGVRDCEACGNEMTFLGRSWLRPPGFAHPVNEREEVSPENVPETSYATRAKLQMPFGDVEGWVPMNERLAGLPVRTRLIVSNSGPAGKGYDYCTTCGKIEANHNSDAVLYARHFKPYPDNEPECKGGFIATGIVLGTDFITDICLFSIKLQEPLSLHPGYDSTNVALRTVCEALSKAAAQMLDIEPGDIVAEHRPALNPQGQIGMEAEVFLYDTLPGGAGFSILLADRSEELFSLALDLMRKCPEGCDSSCYRCLRTYRNKFDHAQLDRQLGIQLLEWILTGSYNSISEDRVERSLNLLYNDLVRNTDANVTCARKAKIELAGGNSLIAPVLLTDVNGRRFVVSMAGSLSPTVSLQQDINEFRVKKPANIIFVDPIDELMIRKSLPSATRAILDALQR